jgi:hypothetical protein
VRAALVLALLVGCTPPEALTPAQRAARVRCYAAADAAAQARVERECPGSFDTCPAASEILDELQAEQEACP